MAPESDNDGGCEGRTSLREEGAEAVVVVFSFALLGQVTVGLDAVLEAVELLGMGLA